MILKSKNRNSSIKAHCSPLMVYMGRNLISKNTEGFWTKLEPEVPPGIPLSSRKLQNFQKYGMYTRVETITHVKRAHQPQTLISHKKASTESAL